MTSPSLFDDDPAIYEVITTSEGPPGALPFTEQMLRDRPSGDLFGWSQNAGMGWKPDEMARDEFLILSTMGGMRHHDGTPVALGLHTGHWEVGSLVETAARTLAARHAIPFAAYCSDPCDGRSQGTTGMFDSLAYRNDAATVFRRLIRSLPTRRGVLGVATCDKGHPAMMMALAGARDMPCILVPGGVTLPPTHGEDAGAIQTIGMRFAQGVIALQEAAELGCRACATPGGGCQFFGTAATSQVVGEALGLSVPHSALAPSGQPIWSAIARRSAEALLHQFQNGIRLSDVLTSAALRNAMVVHAAFGGSTNLLLHIPAVAHAAGLTRPVVDDWIKINRSTPRLVSVLPNGPIYHPTVRVFLAGGVPEVLLQLRELDLIDTTVLTATGLVLNEVLDVWKGSARRSRLRDRLHQQDGVDPDSVIFSPAAAREKGLVGTLAFPTGNVAPHGSVVKATAIDPRVVRDGVFHHVGRARVFASEAAAIRAIKGDDGGVAAGDVLVLAGCGPMGTGMEETYQLTSALKCLPHGHQIALITDARFSGVSTGACIGHIGPEALDGGPIGKLIDGDRLEICIHRQRADGSINLVGHGDQHHGAEWGTAELQRRTIREDLAAHPQLPDDTRLWAALQALGGGTWGGCVYDVDAVIQALRSKT